MNIAYTALVLGYALVGSGSAVAQNAKPLSAAEMKALVGSGASIDIMDLEGGKQYTGALTIAADGTQSGTVTMSGKSPTALTGTWKLKGNQFCRTLKPISDKEACETWVRKSQNEVTVVVGGKPVGLNRFK